MQTFGIHTLYNGHRGGLTHIYYLPQIWDGVGHFFVMVLPPPFSSIYSDENVNVVFWRRSQRSRVDTEDSVDWVPRLWYHQGSPRCFEPIQRLPRAHRRDFEAEEWELRTRNGKRIGELTIQSLSSNGLKSKSNHSFMFGISFSSTKAHPVVFLHSIPDTSTV